MALIEKLRGRYTGTRSAREVSAHLEHLLNAKAGVAAIRSDFGLKGPVTWGAPSRPGEERSAVERLRLEMQRNIECYEPSLIGVQLEAESRDGRGGIFFRLQGTLGRSKDALDVRVRFDTFRRSFRVEKTPS